MTSKVISMDLKPLEFEVKTGEKPEIVLPSLLQELIGIKQGDKVLLSIKELMVKEKDSLEKNREITYIDTTEEELKLFNSAMKDPLYEKIIKGIQSIDRKIEMRKPQKTMVGFYERDYGLVWIAYPVADKIRIHLRKTDYSSINIPPEKFKKSGWGGYPEFNVTSEKDVEYAIKLVKHALGS